MVDESPNTSQLVAAPRHLRKRILHGEIPDTLLVPGVDPLPLETVQSHGAKRPVGIVSARVQTYGRKRAVALLAVIFVSISILALVIALLLES
ncbi:hypothetical protein RCH07_000077 [Arthrobacter sp. CG_A4]|nr:hypothetical protein [Arthrobacter sp. CG_A4]